MVRRWRPALALLTVFVVKLVVVLQLKDHVLLQEDAGLDTTIYLELARRVVGGDLWLGPGLYFVSPLYIYFCAIVLAVTKSITAIRVVQITLGTAAVGLVFVTARNWFGRVAAWTAATIAALTGLFTFYEALVLQAALDPFLIAASLAALTVALRTDISRWTFVAGLFFGLAAMNRPNVVIAVVGLAALLLAARRWRQISTLVAGVVVALSILVLRNGVVSGDWLTLTSHGGLNFYIGNNAGADGTYRSVDGITPNITGQAEDAKRLAEAATGRRLNDVEVSAYFYGRAWRWIVNEPGVWLRLFLHKLHLTISSEHLWLNYSYPFFAHDSRTLLAVLFVSPHLLVPIGLFGLVCCVPREARREYLIWVSFVPFYALSLALFFVSERYRLPLLIPFSVGGGAAVAYASDLLIRREHRRLLASLLVLTALVTVCNWPLRLDDGRTEEQVRMAERLIQRGDSRQAAAWIERALRSSETPGLVYLRAGRALAAAGQPATALTYLQQAAQVDPERAEVHYALGQALLDSGRPSDASAHLRRAFEAGVRPDISGYDLARALAATGRHADALQILERVTPAREDDARSWFALGQLAEQLGSARIAASRYRRAAEALPTAAEPRERYGLMLAQLGEFEGAVRELERAASTDPRSPSIQLNLAVGYASVGRTGDARARAREALRLDPSYRKAKDLLQALTR